MVFYCQRHCYEKEYTTKVVSCKPAKLEVAVDGKKKKKVDCFEITFEDTLLFPEGGGQPDDRGAVEGVSVLRVIRRGGEAVHYLEKPLEVGATVSQSVDWARRHDHMQQHSGQHLITAVADSMYGYATSSWYLGESVSYIELDTPKVSQEEIDAVEENVNQRIRDATPVVITEYDAADPTLKEIRTRGLPEDVVGPVRVVTIENVDANMCCGTHVRNLSDLQAIKLLHTEKGKANKTLLYFVAGQRVLRYLGECVERERQLNTILHSCPADHIRLVEKNQNDLKASLRSLREAMKDLAISEGQKFTALDPRPSVYFHHRRDGDMDYLGAIINEINDETVLKILTVGEDKGPGSLVVHGPQDLVSQIGPKICEILEGRGGGKTRFTGKVTRLGKRSEMEKYVRSILENKTNEG
ncbi:alanyl-tRNA editing protein Aarsd1-like [Penaeus japonicus]|uniref:alanyl-tRNA editing protein Aarsd1-like n=1 Tax=Penaeus japonicus TaxID=27405 RepID=UPI001C70C08A|nr:alanyl-tRNA editing protein Aarsd1-like [Penaeus japonicus]